MKKTYAQIVRENLEKKGDLTFFNYFRSNTNGINYHVYQYSYDNNSKQEIRIETKKLKTMIDGGLI